MPVFALDFEQRYEKIDNEQLTIKNLTINFQILNSLLTINC